MATQRGDPGRYLAETFTVSVRNLLLEGCPAAWKAYLIPVFMTAEGLTISDMIEKLGQRGELPGLEKPGGLPRSDFSRPRGQGGDRGNRVSVLVCSTNSSKMAFQKRTSTGNRLACCVVWRKKRGITFLCFIPCRLLAWTVIQPRTNVWIPLANLTHHDTLCLSTATPSNPFSTCLVGVPLPTEQLQNVVNTSL